MITDNSYLQSTKMFILLNLQNSYVLLDLLKVGPTFRGQVVSILVSYGCCNYMYFYQFMTYVGTEY